MKGKEEAKMEATQTEERDLKLIKMIAEDLGHQITDEEAAEAHSLAAAAVRTDEAQDYVDQLKRYFG